MARNMVTDEVQEYLPGAGLGFSRRPEMSVFVATMAGDISAIG
jgi:hypothetical protein